jgi:hypothetical protein
MKKEHLKKPLRLNAERVRPLDARELVAVAGGATIYNCPTTSGHPPCGASSACTQ